MFDDRITTWNISHLEVSLSMKEYRWVIQGPTLFWLLFCKVAVDLVKKDSGFSIALDEKKVEILGECRIIRKIKKAVEVIRGFFEAKYQNPKFCDLIISDHNPHYFLEGPWSSHKYKIRKLIFDDYVRPTLKKVAEQVGAVDYFFESCNAGKQFFRFGIEWREEFPPPLPSNWRVSIKQVKDFDFVFHDYMNSQKVWIDISSLETLLKMRNYKAILEDKNLFWSFFCKIVANFSKKNPTFYVLAKEDDKLVISFQKPMLKLLVNSVNQVRKIFLYQVATTYILPTQDTDSYRKENYIEIPEDPFFDFISSFLSEVSAFFNFSCEDIKIYQRTKKELCQPIHSTKISLFTKQKVPVHRETSYSNDITTVVEDFFHVRHLLNEKKN